MKERTILCVITDDNNLHEFEIIDNTLTDRNVQWEVVEKLERVLGHDIVDFWVIKDYRK